MIDNIETLGPARPVDATDVEQADEAAVFIVSQEAEQLDDMLPSGLNRKLSQLELIVRDCLRQLVDKV